MAPFSGEKPDEDKPSLPSTPCMSREQVGEWQFPFLGVREGMEAKHVLQQPPEANGKRYQAASLSCSPMSCLDTTGMGLSRQS